MRSLKAGLFLVMFLVSGFFIGCVPGANAATVTVGQTASKASSTYFYYAPGARNAYAVINNAINAAASGASTTNRGVVFIENAPSPYLVDSHILAKSNVNIIGENRGAVTLKIASGITPVGYGGPGTTGWGGPDSSESCGGIINVWTGITNVNISNITLDGSSDDYYASIGRGHQEFPLMNLHGAVNVIIDNVKFTRGADNGMWGNGSSNVEIKNCVFNMIGHDFIEGYNINNLKFHHNIGAMRTNSGVRCAGSSNGCYIYDNEFYTGAGGGAAIELQNTATNVKISNNYFHDISGASGSYGAIGYPGQSPTGSGHEYYNNLFVNMPYAVAHVPASAVSRNNIMINTPTTVGGGTDTNNIKTASGYVFAKNGANGQGNTYWTVSSGSLASTFAGIKVGIRSKAGGSDITPVTITDPISAKYTLTVNGGTGFGSYAQGATVGISANPAVATKIFDKWTGDIGYISNAAVNNASAIVTMPGRAISLTATYKDASVVTTASLTASIVPNTITTVAKGSTNVQLVAIKIINNGSEDITLSGIAIPGVYSPINEVNTNLYAGDTKIGAPTNRMDSVVTYSGLNVRIVKGGSVTLVVKGDLMTTNIRTTMVYPIDSATSITAKGVSGAAAKVTVTAGNSTLTITAVNTKYVLTVSGGTGSGSYASGTSVTVTAKAPATGKVFDKWTGDTSYVSDTASPSLTFAMPAKAITLTATYKDVLTAKYILTVVNGSGSGSYTVGAEVFIKAAASSVGKVFDKWTGEDTSRLSSIDSAIAKVTMPNKAITFTATYKVASAQKYALTVIDGSGTGSYTAGSEIIIKAVIPAPGKVFDKWTGDTAYISNVKSYFTKVTIPEKAATLTATYKDGTADVDVNILIKIVGSPKIYIIIDGEKKWISTPEVFEQLGCKWTNVQTVTDSELKNLPDFEDNLIRIVGDYKVYLVVNGVKRHIPTSAVFLNYGFNWNDIKEVSRDRAQQYANAYLVKESGKEAVYYINSAGVRKWIPTSEIFSSYKDKWEDIQIVSSAEMTIHPLANLIRLEGSKDVYLIEKNIKKRIPSVIVFNKNKFDWNSIATVNATEFNWYKNGGELK